MTSRPALALLVALLALPAAAQSLHPAPEPARAEPAEAVRPPAAGVLLVVVHAEPEGVALPHPARLETSRPFGVGLGGSWLAYGLSGTYDVNDRVTAEAILGVLGALSSVGGRGWYRFNQQEAYDLFAFAGASMYRYGIGGFSETSFGASGGVGIQAGLRELFDNEDFPPIYVSADVGLGFASFDVYGFSAFTAGSGIHYRF